MTDEEVEEQQGKNHTSAPKVTRMVNVDDSQGNYVCPFE